MTNEKVILVTGSSRGIGEGIIGGFADKGFNVVINYARSGREAEKSHDELCSKYGCEHVMLSKADISKRDDVKKMFDDIIDRFGRVDVLVNNAGINIDDSFENITDEKWSRVINTILTGTFICSQEFLFHFKGQEGHIINLGAATALSGRKNGVNYCSAKAGVISLTKCLALELAPKIRVNCIIPGFTDTEEVITRYRLDIKENYDKTANSIPMKRIGNPEDIFKTAYFIVNDSSYITGQNFFVNGGEYMG